MDADRDKDSARPDAAQTAEAEEVKQDVDAGREAIGAGDSDERKAARGQKKPQEEAATRPESEGREATGEARSRAREGVGKGKGKKRGAKGKVRNVREVYAIDEQESAGVPEGLTGDTSANEGDAKTDGELEEKLEGAQGEKQASRPKKGGGKEKGLHTDEERRARLVAQLKAARERKAQIKKEKEAAAGTHGSRGQENGYADQEGPGVKRRKVDADETAGSPTEERNGMVSDDMALTSPQLASAKATGGKKGPRKGLQKADALLQESGIAEAPRIAKGRKRSGAEPAAEVDVEAPAAPETLGVSARTHAPNGFRRAGKVDGKRKAEGGEGDVGVTGKPDKKKGKKKGAQFQTPPQHQIGRTRSKP